MSEELKDVRPDYCQTHGGRWVAAVKDYVRQLSYGEVHIVVHEGKVVQVEKTEKLRF
jgi:hypothetical protein